MGKMTKAQLNALSFLARQEERDGESAVLWQFLIEGHTRQVLKTLRKRGCVEWTSTYSITTAATVAEFLHEQKTTSYIRITAAGRAALAQGEQE